MACVPLMSARPSFGAERRPARARRARARRRPGTRARRRRRRVSPSPTSTSARCASGARSPLAPTEPRLGTSGCTPRVEQREQRLERLDANAGEALRQHVRAQRHRRAHGAHRQRLADAGGVAAQQIQLQRGELRRAGSRLGERAEAGVDAVDRRVAVGACDRPRRARRDASRAAGASRRRRDRARSRAGLSVRCDPSSRIIRASETVTISGCVSDFRRSCIPRPFSACLMP